MTTGTKNSGTKKQELIPIKNKINISRLTKIIELPLHSDVVATTSVVDTAMPQLTINDCSIILPTQTHSDNVAWVTDEISEYPETDALITRRTDIAIGIRTADCVPILLYASDIKAVAAIHAGWKGTLNGITNNVIDNLLSAGALPENIYATFGAAICRDCYEVDFPLAEKFKVKGFDEFIFNNISTDPLTGKSFKQLKPHIDLIGINIARLKSKNIPLENIKNEHFCTRHNNHLSNSIFHSYRRDNATNCRNFSFIKLKNTEKFYQFKT